MPDPSELSPARPERPAESTHAPLRLRGRVLARVRAEPEPVVSGTFHVARRLLGERHRRAALTLFALAGTGAILLTAVLLDGGARTLGRTLVAQELGAARASLHRVDGHAELRPRSMSPAACGASGR